MSNWEYKATLPMLPPGADSPFMNERQMEGWLNEMNSLGWEFVSYAQKHWGGYAPTIQDWWIFRREIK